MSQEMLPAAPAPLLRIVPWALLIAGILFCPVAIYMFGMLGVYAAVGVAALLLSLFTHPLVVFALYFGALFFRDTTFGGLPISLNQVLAPLFFASTLVHFLRGKANTPRFAMLPVLSIIVLYFVVSGLTAEDFENGLLYARYAIIYLLLAVSVAMVINSERKTLVICWIIVISTTIAAAHGFYEVMDKNLLNVVGQFWGSGRRATGTAPNSVVFGWNLVFGFPFAFFLFSELRSGITRILALAMGLSMLTIATFTFNRQTYVIMAIVVAACALLYSYKNRAVLLSALAVMGTVGAFTVLPLVLRRMLTVANLTKDYSYLERHDSFLVGLEMFKAHPLTGVGFGSFSVIWYKYLPPDYGTYFLQYRGSVIPKFMDMGMFSILAETGLIGLGLFLVMMAIFFTYAWKQRRAAIRMGDTFVQNYASMVIVTLLFFLVSAFIQDNFLYTRIWILYGLLFLLDSRHLPPRSPGTTPPIHAVRPGHKALPNGGKVSAV